MSPLYEHSEIETGTYTPDFTNVANVSGFGAIQEAAYKKTNDMVTVSGIVSVNPGLVSLNTQFRMSLPIETDFTQTSDLSGTFAAKNSASLSGAINADLANNAANFQYMNTLELAEKEFSFHFQYIVK